MTTFHVAVLEVKQNGGMGFVEDYLQWCQDDAGPGHKIIVPNIWGLIVNSGTCDEVHLGGVRPSWPT
jgi:hypothetical protein